jgi:hypothetical protein
MTMRASEVLMDLSVREAMTHCEHGQDLSNVARDV